VCWFDEFPKIKKRFPKKQKKNKKKKENFRKRNCNCGPGYGTGGKDVIYDRKKEFDS